MKNTFGQNISITLFGESHGPAIGAVIDGLPAGIPVDEEYLAHKLYLRRPHNELSTARSEKDVFSILSGVFRGFTCGTPVCITIPNSDTRSGDYSYGKARPSHADFAAFAKYGGHEDYRGGGHFSGRLTAALVAAGALLQYALKIKGIRICTHISEIYGITDRGFNDPDLDIAALENEYFAVLDKTAGEKMREAILAAKADGDSVGGILETIITGVPAGVGEPWFDTFEGILSHALFSIPAVKGIEFGGGFGLAKLRGSEANDPLRIQDGKVVAEKNMSGGINGGIANGMPVLFKTVIKPTPTISKEQNTIDFLKMENTVIASAGRHDPCIVQRARAAVDAVSAMAVCDLITARFGTEYLK